MITSSSSVPAASAVALTTNTPAAITSQPLTPGNYLAWGFVDATLAGATITSLIASLALASATVTPQPGSNVGGNRLYPDATAQEMPGLTTATGTKTLRVGPVLMQVLNTGTLYLNTQATFSAGTVSAYGSLYALPLPA